MFIVGMAAGVWGQSTSLMADALDMLADAAAYALSLAAVNRSKRFKHNAARVSGVLILVLGLGVVADIVRRFVVGSEPHASVMMIFSFISFGVNLTVLNMLMPFRKGEVHLRAAWIITRVDVIANVAVFASGALIYATGIRNVDLVVGLAIGLYVFKEALEIFSETEDRPPLNAARSS